MYTGFYFIGNYPLPLAEGGERNQLKETWRKVGKIIAKWRKKEAIRVRDLSRHIG
jgi:hypothetical protein